MNQCIPLGPFKICSKIFKDIREWTISGVNDTLAIKEKYLINFIREYLSEFSKKFETAPMDTHVEIILEKLKNFGVQPWI